MVGPKDHSMKDRILVGNVVLYAHKLRELLKNRSRWMLYDADEDTLTIYIYVGMKGHKLLELRNVPYESAAKLAEHLGLSAESDEEFPTRWSRHYPRVHLHHNGGEVANEVLLELIRSGIPHDVTANSSELALVIGDRRLSGSWQAKGLLDEVKDALKPYMD